ncbi:unnamed protein product [Camellia sinensis]
MHYMILVYELISNHILCMNSADFEVKDFYLCCIFELLYHRSMFEDMATNCLVKLLNAYFLVKLSY